MNVFQKLSYLSFMIKAEVVAEPWVIEVRTTCKTMSEWRSRDNIHIQDHSSHIQPPRGVPSLTSLSSILGKKWS